VIDDSQAEITGYWVTSGYGKPVMGCLYQHDDDARDGTAKAVFEANLPKAGRYEVRLAYVTAGNRATNTPVIGNYSIWAAVGNNFHTPFNFGALVTKDFPRWCAEKLQAWTAERAKAAAQSDKPGLQFADRLKRTGEFSKTLATQTAGEQAGWEQITRTYALMNFVDTVYRVMDAEMRYARFFSGQ
jgi:hypothetical protein